MPTDVEIANMVLGKLGTRATVSDIDEDSIEARAVRRWFNQTRDRLLRKMQPSFARVYVDLAASGTPPTRWAASYAYPADCLHFWGFDIGSPLPFPTGLCVIFERGTDATTNQFIWCDLSPATGVYTQRVEPGRFDSSFTDAMVAVLAWQTCLEITNKRELMDDLRAEARALVEEAEVDSANEQITAERERVAESLSVRGFDGYGLAWDRWPWWPGL